MSFFLYSLGSELRTQFTSWRSWLMLLLLPVMTAALMLGLPKEEIAAPVQVGVVLPDGQGEAFWEYLSARSDSVVSFVRCDEDTMRAKVSTGQWDCGILLDEDFDALIKKLDTRELVTFFTGPGSTVYPVVQETAASAVLSLVCDGMALRYMEQKGIDDTYHPEVLGQDRRVLISLQTRTGETTMTYELADTQLGSILLLCLGLVLLIWALFGAMDLGKWMDRRSVLRYLMVRDRRVLLLSRGCAMLCVSLAGAVAAVVLLPQRLAAWMALVPYLMSIWTLALLLSRVKVLWSALPSLMSGVVVVSVLTQPSVLELTGLDEVWGGAARWLPLNQFLQAAQGDLSALGRSWLTAGVLLGAFLLWGDGFRLRRKSAAADGSEGVC